MVNNIVLNVEIGSEKKKRSDLRYISDKSQWDSLTKSIDEGMEKSR